MQLSNSLNINRPKNFNSSSFSNQLFSPQKSSVIMRLFYSSFFDHCQKARNITLLYPTTSTAQMEKSSFPFFQKSFLFWLPSCALAISHFQLDFFFESNWNQSWSAAIFRSKLTWISILKLVGQCRRDVVAKAVCATKILNTTFHLHYTCCA